MNYQNYQNPMFPNQQPYKQPPLPNGEQLNDQRMTMPFNPARNVQNNPMPNQQPMPNIQPMPNQQPIPNQQQVPTPIPQTPPTQPSPAGIVSSGIAFRETSYIENILRLNKGKLGYFYYSFPDSFEWRNKVFVGFVEQAGRDHIIIKSADGKEWYLLLLIYLDYVTFNEPINYDPSFSIAD